MHVPERFRPWMAALGAAVVAFAVYAGSLHHGFVFDDGPEIVENSYVRSLSDVPRLFTTSSWAGAGIGKDAPIWRPLTTLSYALNYAAGGFDPMGFHLVNVLLNALASALVVFLALELGVPIGGAFVSGLLFALMPVHVEAVANVAGRKEILAALFAIGALLAHRGAVRRGGPGVLLAPLFVAGGLLSKESGLAILGVLAAHDLFLGQAEVRAHRGRAAALYAVYAAAVVAFVAGRHAVLGTLVFPGTPFLDNPVAGAPAGVRILTAVAVIGRGLLLLVAPVSLSPDYSFAAIPPVTSAVDPAFIASLAAVAVILALAFASRRRFPLGLFAAAWYGITLFPASNLIVPIGTIFGERLLYVPSVGLALVAGAGAAAVLRGPARRWAGVAITTLLLAYGATSWAYAAEWKDQLTLFGASVRAQPESSKAQRMLGGELIEAGRIPEARAAFERAIAILGNARVPPSELTQPLVELGVAYEKLGQLGDAERLFLRALSSEPNHADALWRLGVVRWQQGRRGDGIELWRQAVGANPRHAPALNDLGVAAYLGGDLDGAEAMWTRATEADPRVASAWYRLGNLLEKKGDLNGARRAWNRFLEMAHDRTPEQRAEVAGKLGASAAPR